MKLQLLFILLICLLNYLELQFFFLLIGYLKKYFWFCLVTYVFVYTYLLVIKYISINWLSFTFWNGFDED